jgi:hypothetical protein
MRVAVVTAGFARTFWPDGDAIGRQISLPGRGDGLLRVVGTVEDGKYRNLGDRRQPFVFLPMAQSYSGLATIVVRTPRAPSQVIAEIRRELERLDPHLPVFGAMPLTEHLRLPLFPARVAGAALGSFGVLSVVLAAIGLFGVMAHRVRQRTHEIGLRMALGAARRDVVRMLLGQSMATVAAGVAVGLAGAYALTRLMTGLIFGVSATDPLTFAGVAMLLVSVALAASYLPARRATRVDPLIALRHE